MYENFYRKPSILNPILNPKLNQNSFQNYTQILLEVDSVLCPQLTQSSYWNCTKIALVPILFPKINWSFLHIVFHFYARNWNKNFTQNWPDFVPEIVPNFAPEIFASSFTQNWPIFLPQTDHNFILRIVLKILLETVPKTIWPFWTRILYLMLYPKLTQFSKWNCIFLHTVTNFITEIETKFLPKADLILCPKVYLKWYLNFILQIASNLVT